MICEAKALLTSLITQYSPDGRGTKITTVVLDATEEKNAIVNRKFPFASIITGQQGSFDNSRARNAAVRRDDGTVQKVFVRGERTLPLVIRVWTETQSTAEAVIDALLPYIPVRWDFGVTIGLVEVVGTDISDFTTNMSKQVCAALTVRFTADYARTL